MRAQFCTVVVGMQEISCLIDADARHGLADGNQIFLFYTDFEAHGEVAPVGDRPTRCRILRARAM